MPQPMFLVVLIVVFGAIMLWQSKQAKKQQQQQQDFRTNLQPGTEVITIGRIIGKVVEVDNQYDEIVIDSEGTRMRLALSAIAREYTRPAYISDDEVDENGNPLPKDEIEAAADDETAQSAEASDEAQEAVEADRAKPSTEAKND